MLKERMPRRAMMSQVGAVTAGAGVASLMAHTASAASPAVNARQISSSGQVRTPAPQAGTAGSSISNGGGSVTVNADGSISMAPASGVGVTITGNGAATALTITPGGSAPPSTLDIYGTTSSYPLRIFTATAPPGWNPQTFINQSGAIETNAWVVISGTPNQGTSAAVQAKTAARSAELYYPSSDPFMLGIWSDIIGPGLQVRTNGLSGSYNYSNLDDVGNHTFCIEGNGKLQWGATTRAAMDTNLYRLAAGALQTDGSFQVGGNLGVGVSGHFGGGLGVLGIANAGAVPSSTPTRGGVLYASGGALYWLGSNGTTTKLASA